MEKMQVREHASLHIQSANLMTRFQFRQVPALCEQECDIFVAQVQKCMPNSLLHLTDLAPEKTVSACFCMNTCVHKHMFSPKHLVNGSIARCFHDTAVGLFAAQFLWQCSLLLAAAERTLLKNNLLQFKQVKNFCFEFG